jgi:hypothetical protein
MLTRQAWRTSWMSRLSEVGLVSLKLPESGRLAVCLTEGAPPGAFVSPKLAREVRRLTEVGPLVVRSHSGSPVSWLVARRGACGWGRCGRRQRRLRT